VKMKYGMNVVMVVLNGIAVTHQKVTAKIAAVRKFVKQDASAIKDSHVTLQQETVFQKINVPI
jgi:hypothetical protein